MREAKVQIPPHHCRICFDDDYVERLVSPCKCNGSIKFVHSSCLSDWIFSKQEAKKRGTVLHLLCETLLSHPAQKQNKFKCDICLHEMKYIKHTDFGPNTHRVRIFMIITLLLSIILTIASLFAASMVSTGLMWYTSQGTSSWHPTLAFVDFDTHYLRTINSLRHRTTPKLRTIYERDHQICRSYDVNIYSNPTLLHTLFRFRSMSFSKRWKPFWSYRFSMTGLYAAVTNFPVFLDYLYFGLFLVPLMLVFFDFSWRILLQEFISCLVFMYGKLAMLITFMYMYASSSRVDAMKDSVIGMFFGRQYFPSVFMHCIMVALLAGLMLYKLLKAWELFQFVFLKVGSMINKRFPYAIQELSTETRMQFFDLK